MSLDRHRPSRYTLKRRRSPGRALWAGLMAIGVMAAVLLVGGYFALPLIVETAAPRLLAARGLGPASLDVQRFGASGIQARDITLLGGAIRIQSVNAGYDFGGLWEGRIRSVDVAGFNVDAAWDENGLRIGSLPLWPRQPQAPQAAGDAPRTIIIENLAVQDAVAEISTPQGPLGLELNATAARQGEAMAADVLASLRGDGALITAAWKGTRGDDGGLDGTGRLELDIAERALPGFTGSLTAQGALGFEASANGFRLSSAAPLSVTIGPVNESAISALPAPLAVMLRDHGATLRLGGSQGGLLAEMVTGNATASSKLDLTLDADLGVASVKSAALGQFTGLPGEIPQDFVIDLVAVETIGLPLDIGALNANVRITELRGPIAAAEGVITAGAQITKPAMNMAAAEDAKLALSGRLRLDGMTIAVETESLDVSVSDMAIGERVRLPGLTTFTLAPAADPQTPQTLSVVFGAAGTSLAYGLDLAVREQPLMIGTNDAPQGFILDLPRVRVDGYLTPGTAAQETTLTVSEGRISHDHAEATAIDLQGRLAEGRFSGSGDLRLTRLLAAPPRNPNAAVTGLGPRFTYDFQIDSESTEINGEIFGTSEIAIGAYQLRTAPANGAFSVDIPRQNLGDGGLAAHELLTSRFPLTGLSGTFGLKAETSWDASASRGSAEVLLGNMDFQYGSMDIQGLNTVLALDSIWPPHSAAPQPIAIAAVTAGLPLTDVKADVILPGDGLAVVQNLDMDMAEGKISGRDLRIPMDGREGKFALNVDGVSIAALAAMAQLDGLSATGTLSGTVPVRVTSADILVENGTLTTVAPGNISYQPVNPPAALSGTGGSSELLLKALANFEYDSLQLTLNGSATRELAAGLALKGRNPDLYGGYPIEFNLNLSGALSQIMRQSLVGYRIPAEIERQLNAFGAGGATPQ